LGSRKGEVTGTGLLEFDAEETSLDWIVWTQRGDVLISKAGGTYIYHCNLEDLELQTAGSNANGQTGLLRTCCVRFICAPSFTQLGIWCESALLLSY
jgi:hypothetical protein